MATLDSTRAPLPGPSELDTAYLLRFLDGDWADLRALARTGLTDLFADTKYGLPVDEHRTRTTDRLAQFLQKKELVEGFLPADGGAPNPGRGINLLEMLGMVDPSLAIKVGVQLGLFGGAILNLGTEKHHRKYLPAAASGELLGCFAMTEVGHGSNVQDLGTTATYDPDTKTFVIHTPNPTAAKKYIGNAARDGRMAVVFARVIVGGVDHGVHALMCPLRDDDGEPLPGVTLTDDGAKGGLNGVDNGSISFDSVRVPRDALLDKYAAVTEDGTYVPTIEDPGRRFRTMLRTLVTGRGAVAGAANGAAKTALTIAVNYSMGRRQFAGSDGQEKPLLDYQLHQQRLLVPLARAYAMHFVQQELAADIHAAFVREAEGFPLTSIEQAQLESRANIIKAMASDVASETVDGMRTACGGAGFILENLIVQLRGDTDIYRTFEGDNNVLRLAVAKDLASGFGRDLSKLNPAAAALFAASHAWGGVREHTPIRNVADLLSSIKRRPAEAQASRQEEHLKIFDKWERHIVERFALRLKKDVDRGVPEIDAFNGAGILAVKAANAHGYKLALEAFVRNIAKCEDPEIAKMLNKLCDIFAESTMELLSGDLQAHDVINSQRALRLGPDLAQSYTDFRPYTGVAVDGLGVAEDWISATIGVRPDVLDAPSVAAAQTSARHETRSVLRRSGPVVLGLARSAVTALPVRRPGPAAVNENPVERTS